MPMTVTAMAVFLPLSFADRLSAEMPALHASRKVVVTVEKTRMISAAMPSPALTMMTGNVILAGKDGRAHADAAQRQQGGAGQDLGQRDAAPNQIRPF